MPDIDVNCAVYDIATQPVEVGQVLLVPSIRQLIVTRADGTPPSNGSITGRVIKDSNPVPYVVVRLYYRVTGELIDQTVTDANGDFVFTGYNQISNNYFIVADIEHPQAFPLKGFDKVTPVADP